METTSLIRHDWTLKEVKKLIEQPFADLLFQAQVTHRQHFNPNCVQTSKILSVKTGACPEDCAYCPQSARYKTGLKAEKLYNVAQVMEHAKAAKAKGATRFCMGGAWRELKDKFLKELCVMIAEVKALGLETCLTVGMLTEKQAQQFKEAGLDYYNHNLDTSPKHYKKIITTRTYQERLDTLEQVRKAGIKVCCGGIIGMGETCEDRMELLRQLANLPQHPESVPINKLIPIKGTPLENTPEIESFEFIRTIACARIMMPKAFVRISAGRATMNEEMQALCFFAGANAIWLDEKLLTQDSNPELDKDEKLFEKLGIEAMTWAQLNKPSDSVS